MSDDYPNEVPFEDELEKAKAAATQFEPCMPGEFRKMISYACLDTYEGLRSVDGFVRFAEALVKDEDGYFAKYNISAQMLFINSLKSQDIDLEILREESSTKPENAELLKRQSNNLNAMISELVKANVISSGDCKMHFSSQLLKDANVIPNKLLFDRRLVRLNTAMLYKQHKFNLTREDSEGYAGLINNMTYASIDNERDSKGKLSPIPLERVPEFLNTISSHIGAFYLDPNRVLDIILDFFIKQLTINYQFWIELIKQSGWIQKLSSVDQNTQESISSSAIMAQLIGFRFHNYHYEELVPAPKEYYLATAILLKNRLILLGDILPHMIPFEEDMTKEKEKYISNMNKETTSNTGGMLGTYGALGEEGATQKVKRTRAASQDDESAIAEKKYPANDVVELTKALISVGDMYHAEMILAKYDKLCDLYPQLANDLYRICRVVLQPAYELFVPQATKAKFKHFAECAEQSELKVALSTSDEPNPTIPDQIKLKRVLVTDALLNEKQDLTKKERYVFFYKEWANNLELCEMAEHLTTRFMPLMRLAGYRTYLATDLVQKLLHITGGLLDREAEFPGSRVHCMNMIREFLIPAVSFSKGNPGTMADVWDILSRLSFQERYCIYGEWMNDFYKKNIETKLLKARVERAAKFVMRRVSKNDVRQCGRDLGKLAHSNPTIVFNTILDQVQQFDNMAPLMADACRYLGDFSYDVLCFIMTEKWTGSQGAGRTKKPKEKEEGIPNTWIRALAVNLGMLFKKQDIDPTPLLRYIVYRLRHDDSVSDLVLLNEFITKMGGIEILASAYTDEQIIAAGCLETLKAEAFLPVSIDNRRASRRVLSRLKEALRKNNYALEILVLLYRLGESVSRAPNLNASERCSQLDRVHQTQLQYFELLTSLFEGEEYNTLIPNADVLVNDYGISLDTAMNFVRPKTQYTIKAKIETPIVEGECWEPIQPLVSILPSIMPDPNITSVFSPEFFALFWQLSLYDIHCPVSHYENAIKRHTDMIRQCQDTRSSFYQSNRPSVVNKAERQAQASLETLKEDLPKHQAHVDKVLSVLKESQQRWFPSTVKRVALISHIMQYCLLPRSTQSEVDAAFCYEFVMLMHRLGVKNFSSLTLFDKVLSENLPAVFSSFTEYETTIHARFIFKTLNKMSAWHSDEKLYIKEAHGKGLIGFQKNWSAQPNATNGQEIATEDLLNFSEFKRVLHKWHFKACGAIEQALNSGESHPTTNAFLVLRQFIPCFPMVSQHGESIIKIINKLSKVENRGNIKVLARSYLGLIEKSKSKWVTRNVFLGTEKEGEASSTAAPAQPTTVSLDKKSSSSTTTKEDHSSSNTTSTSTANGNHHSSSSTSSSRHVSSSSTSNAKPSSPTRRTETKSTGSADSPPSERKRAREAETSSREKSQRLDESGNGTSRHKSSSSSSTTTATTSTAPAATNSSSNTNGASAVANSSAAAAANSSSTSSSRNSPRESSSRTNTPLREPVRIRDPAREAIREAARENARENTRDSSTRSSKESPRLSSSTGTTSSSSRSAAAATRDERPTRTSSSTARTSSSAASSPSESRREDDRRVTSSSTPARSSSASRGTKRTIDVDRERPEKRRDHRDERDRDRGREERTREDRSKERSRGDERAREERPREDRTREDRAREDRAREDRTHDRLREDRLRDDRPREDRLRDDRRDDRIRDRRVDDRRVDDRRLDDRRARDRDDRRRRR